ncbi:MAG: hypothetical protein AABX73_02905 [Nanoarchaeota archaeon]
MEREKFFKLFFDSGKDFYKKYWVIGPSILLWLVLGGLSKLSVFVNYKLNNSSFIAIWFVLLSLFTLGAMAFLFSGLIGISRYAAENKRSLLREFFLDAKKFFFRNFCIIIIIAFVSALIGRITHYTTLFAGRFLELSILSAQIIFVLIYFLLLVGILIFFSFSSFYLVIYNLSLKESIKNSFSLVRREYLSVLTLTIIFFLAFFFLGRVEGLLGELIEYVILIPYVSLLMVRFVLYNERPKS